jgi:VanZ family protein
MAEPCLQVDLATKQRASGVSFWRLLLWPVWLTVFALWTAALLTTFPVEVNKALFTPEAGFTAGKSLHVAAYAGLTLLGLVLPLPAGWRLAPVAVLSLHAFGTEWVQPFVGRTGSLRDVLLDHLGILLGLALGGALRVRAR